MSWTLLPTNYTDAIWSGLKKYILVNNEDGTISLQDVTQYSNKENSFFGAMEANRMNEALNTIMSMVENGTDLYEAFQNYFSNQKVLFEDILKADTKSFEDYIADLKAKGDSAIATIKTDYRTEMDEYEALQTQLFNVWFDSIRDKLSGDVATKLQNEIDELNTKVEGFVAKDISFSPDGKHITETSGTLRRETVFNTDGSITEKLYDNDILIHTKNTTFSADGSNIKEEVS